MFCNVFVGKKVQQDAIHVSTPKKHSVKMAPQISLNNSIKQKTPPTRRLATTTPLFKGDETLQRPLLHPDGLRSNPVGSSASVFSPAVNSPIHLQLGEDTFDSFFSHPTLLNHVITTKPYPLSARQPEKKSGNPIKTEMDNVKEPESRVGGWTTARKLERAALEERLREKNAELREMEAAIEFAKKEGNALLTQIRELVEVIVEAKKKNERSLAEAGGSEYEDTALNDDKGEGEECDSDEDYISVVG